jgi:signal transduction histidine kinase
MARVASSSREMISRLNVIVWALNPKYDTLDSLVTYLRRYFGEYLENFGIRFQIDLPEQVPEVPITPDTRRNIFYALQEAIHNAVKHGACSEVGLSVKIHGQKMEITVTDNGKGFEKAKAGSGGNGLPNMKKRTEDLGGNFGIQSSPGKGTKVLFLFRFSGSEPG